MAERLRGRAGVAQRKRRLTAEPLCRMCRTKGLTTAADVIDHEKPLALGGTDTDDNCRALCHPCHDKVTRQQFGLRHKPRIALDGWPEEG